MEMLNKIPLFTQWSLAQLASLYKHFIKVDLEYSQVVYEQGVADDNVYIILKGEIDLEVKFEIDDTVNKALRIEKYMTKKPPIVVEIL